jgi:formylglycine-generating enzyme required for sulfatase activity
MHRCLLIAVAFAALASPPPSKPNESRAVNDGYLDLVYVPAGQFRMGDNFGDGESRERPVHIVDLDAFYIGKYEVTNGDWRKFRDDPGYNDPKFC